MVLSKTSRDAGRGFCDASQKLGEQTGRRYAGRVLDFVRDPRAIPASLVSGAGHTDAVIAEVLKAMGWLPEACVLPAAPLPGLAPALIRPFGPPSPRRRRRALRP